MTGVVSYVDDVPSGLSSMLGELIDTRLAAHPRRLTLLHGSKVGVRASDIGLSSTLYLDPGAVRVRNGMSRSTDLRVRADSATLMLLSGGSTIPRPGEIPRIVKAMREGRLQIEGLPRGTVALLRFRRLLAR